MGVTRGCLGKVKVKDAAATGSASRMYEMNAWEFTESAERIDSSQMGDCTKSFTAGAKETTGSFTVWWDASATSNQGDMTVGNDVYFEVYPGGDGSGATFYRTATGGANVNEVSRSASLDGVVETTFSYAVNGELTATAVP